MNEVCKYFGLVKEDEHYDNTNGSLYKFASDHNLNAYEFDIIKRIVRCRKKGQFTQDLEKTKRVIDLYLKETTKWTKYVKQTGADLVPF